MKALIPLAIVLLVPLSASGKLQVGTEGKVYKGPDGMKVTFVPLKKPDKKVLIKFKGVDNEEIDGLVILHDVVKLGRRGTGFVTPIHGKRWITFSKVTERWWGWSWQTMQVRIYGVRGVTNVSYSEQDSKKVKPKEILAQHLKQTARLEKLAAFSRSDEQNGVLDEIKAEREHAEKVCGLKFTMEMDWTTITNDTIKEYSVSAFCARPFGALRRLCESKPASKKIVKRKVRSVYCKWGKKLSVKLKKKKITIVVDPNQSNQDDFVRAALEKAL